MRTSLVISIVAALGAGHLALAHAQETPDPFSSPVGPEATERAPSEAPAFEDSPAAETSAKPVHAPVESWENVASGQEPAPRKSVNLITNADFKDLRQDGTPRHWRLNNWNGDEPQEGKVQERGGHHGGACMVIASKEWTDSGFQTEPIAVKPETTYRFAIRIKTEGVETEGPAKGAVFTAMPMQASTEAVTGTSDWKWVRGWLTTGGETSVEMAMVLGGQGNARGKAWFQSPILFEAGGQPGDEPKPEPYRRPMMDDPLFNREGLTLDKDQVAELAEQVAAFVCNFSDMDIVKTNRFRACALGLAMRLDPRNRTAVVANGMLDGGQSPRPVSKGSGLRQSWSELDKCARWLHGDTATADDKILGAYLGDLTREVLPDEGFGPEYVKFHAAKGGAEWGRVLPPAPESQPPPDEQPPDVAENDSGNVAPEAPVNEPVTRPLTPGTGTVAPQGKIKLGASFPLKGASLLTPVMTGGIDSRAAMRRVSLKRIEYIISKEERWEEDGVKWVDIKIPIDNTGPTFLMFSDDLHRLREMWDSITFEQVRQRYTGWPQGGAVEVSIPEYRESSGSSAILATAISLDAMARGLSLNPKTAAIGTWSEQEHQLATHSHLPGVLLWYGRDWSDVLIVGPGSGGNLQELAKTGLVSPYLNTQIIEVQSLDEAVDIAAGRYPDDLKKSLDAFRSIQMVRTKMDPPAMAQNRFVLDKVREVATAFPRHLSATLFLKAAEYQKPMDYKDSISMVQRLYQGIEQLGDSDLRWVTEEEAAQTLEVFNDRMREFRPRFDRNMDRLEIRLDDATRAVEEVTHIKDRTTGTAMRRIELARQKIKATRQAIDLSAAAAGR